MPNPTATSCHCRYPTFCNMAGVDPDDGYTAAPADGVDVWNAILHPNAVHVHAVYMCRPS